MTGTRTYDVISSDGTRIRVWQSGSGPPLVAVHGTTADHARWTGVSTALEARFTVHAMDRRGRGHSGDNLPYSLEREGEDVAAVVREAGENATLLGHSYGALCCMEAALQLPGLSRLILYEPPLHIAMVAKETHAELERLIERGEREAALKLFFRDVVRASETQLENLQTHPAWSARIASAHTIPRESNIEAHYRLDPGRLATLDVPTLLLLGGDSPAGFREATMTLHAAIPHSSVVELPGQQHIAMDTAPALFVAAVMDFAASGQDD